MLIEQKGFIHHVLFWLKNEDSKEHLNLLLAGLTKLSGTPGIKEFQIGFPAGTLRDVVDNSYAVSLLLVFANKDDHDHYQMDPMHLKFIADCSHLWKKVMVFDTISAGV